MLLDGMSSRWYFRSAMNNAPDVMENLIGLTTSLSEWHVFVAVKHHVFQLINIDYTPRSPDLTLSQSWTLPDQTLPYTMYWTKGFGSSRDACDLAITHWENANYKTEEHDAAEGLNMSVSLGGMDCKTHTADGLKWNTTWWEHLVHDGRRTPRKCNRTTRLSICPDRIQHVGWHTSHTRCNNLSDHHMRLVDYIKGRTGEHVNMWVCPHCNVQGLICNLQSCSSCDSVPWHAKPYSCTTNDATDHNYTSYKSVHLVAAFVKRRKIMWYLLLLHAQHYHWKERWSPHVNIPDAIDGT